MLPFQPLTRVAGNFDPATLTGTVDGAYWAQVLNTRLGLPAGTITQGEPYSFAGCSSNAACVFPVDRRRLCEHSAGSLVRTIRQHPSVHSGADSPGDSQNYSNNSQRNIRQRQQIRGTGGFQQPEEPETGRGITTWTIRTSDSALAGFATVPGFPTSTPSRAQQFVMSNTKTLGATAVNEARISFFRNVLHKDNPAASFAGLSSLGFVTGAGTLGIIPLAGYKEYVPQIQFQQLWAEHWRAHAEYVSTQHHIHDI